ncbi:HAD-IA family hydrolase [Alkalibaculum sp. M08DMB]|uniref:HAD-IA family hydrolase n=1 Tax=Alkalibaculum sporogenes TaxID=2655001 RepID=A0A6A7K989_9FIRM|nr:HAD family phosphatase [Alkalibaculum sporogenes]MPW26079.1 HAD-IA family hydrolase [Alkalibaculum sporogenes]
MSEIKGVVFDMDGVIIDSEPTHFECNIRTLMDFNVISTYSDFEKYVGVADHVMWASIISENNLDTTVEKIIEKQDQHREILFKKESIKAVDGTINLIKLLSEKKYKIGLASSSPRNFINMILKELEISKYFDAVVSGNEVVRSKPEPDIYIKAASQIGVEPRLCVAIEDAKNGVHAAKSAGMFTIGFKNVNSGNQDLSSAHKIIYHMNEVMEILFP